MKLSFYLLFIFYTLLFLFYPGDLEMYQLFANNRDNILEIPLAQPKKIMPIPAVKPNSPQPLITGEGAYIVDLDTFTPIFEKNAHQTFFPASTTKIITALVTRDLYDPDEIVTVKEVQNTCQVMGLFPGEKITVENLLYGTLVHSGNDGAYALADHYGREKYLQLMNEKAKKLGMKDSVFKNPAGLDDYSQVTTPYDLTLAARELLRDKLLRKIVGTKEITISDVDYKAFHTLSNVNKLLGEIQGIGGLKTGYTEAAGENLVSFYKHEGHQYIIVILKSADRFSDTRNLVGWIDSNITYSEVPTLE